MANSSTIRRQQENRTRNVTPSDVYRQEYAYFYRLSNPDAGTQYITWKEILALLSNNINLITFSIERIKELKGLWGDSVNVASIKGFKQRSATTLTIPDFDQEELRIDEAYLITTQPLEDYVNDNGTITESPDVQWWVTVGKVERGKNKQVIFSLETMNSYDWQTQNDTSGITINKIIELSLVNRRGESVKQFMVEFDADALIQLPKGIKFLDDNNIDVDWDVDWEKTNLRQFDITHINPLVKNDSVAIESYALSCFKFYEWLKKAATTSIGIPYNALNYASFRFDIPDFMTSVQNVVYLTGKNTINGGDNEDTKKQINTEFIENMEYFIFLENNWLLSGYPPLATFFEARDLSDDVKNNTIRKLIPDGVIAEVSSSKTLTYANAADKIGDPSISPTFDNQNIDNSPWWYGDWKENRYPADSNLIGLNWLKDSIMKVIIGQILPRKLEDQEYVKNIINNLLTGKTNTYKGMAINEMPEVLENVVKPDNYADFTETDKDFYVLSTFDVKGHYETYKDYYESLAPTRTNSLKKYASDKKGDRFDFLDPQSIKGLFFNFLWKQESGKSIKIYGTFKEAIKMPKTYDFKFIDGGKSYALSQYRDTDLNPALDADGNEVSIIRKKTTWYRQKDRRYIRNSGTFAESAVKGIYTGKIITNEYLKKK